MEYAHGMRIFIRESTHKAHPTLRGPRDEPRAEPKARASLMLSTAPHTTRVEHSVTSLATDNMELSDSDPKTRTSQAKYLAVTDQHEPSLNPVCVARGLVRR